MKKSGKTKKDFEVYIKRIVEKYKKVLFLDKFSFDIKDGVQKPENHYDTSLNYPYLNTVISYSEKAFEDWRSGEDQAPYIIHELCHAITDPLYTKTCQRFASKDEVRDEMERLTDYICQIIVKNNL